MERDGFVVDGELTIKGITRPVPLTVEANGVGPDASGGDQVQITIEIEAVLRPG